MTRTRVNPDRRDNRASARGRKLVSVGRLATAFLLRACARLLRLAPHVCLCHRIRSLKAQFPIMPLTERRAFTHRLRTLTGQRRVPTWRRMLRKTSRGQRLGGFCRIFECGVVIWTSKKLSSLAVLFARSRWMCLDTRQRSRAPKLLRQSLEAISLGFLLSLLLCGSSFAQFNPKQGYFFSNGSVGFWGVQNGNFPEGSFSLRNTGGTDPNGFRSPGMTFVPSAALPPGALVLGDGLNEWDKYPSNARVWAKQTNPGPCIITHGSGTRGSAGAWVGFNGEKSAATVITQCFEPGSDIKVVACHQGCKDVDGLTFAQRVQAQLSEERQLLASQSRRPVTCTGVVSADGSPGLYQTRPVYENRGWPIKQVGLVPAGVDFTPVNPNRENSYREGNPTYVAEGPWNPANRFVTEAGSSPCSKPPGLGTRVLSSLSSITARQNVRQMGAGLRSMGVGGAKVGVATAASALPHATRAYIRDYAPNSGAGKLIQAEDDFAARARTRFFTGIDPVTGENVGKGRLIDGLILHDLRRIGP